MSFINLHLHFEISLHIEKKWMEMATTDFDQLNIQQISCGSATYWNSKGLTI